jgi:hypothetical protein
MNICNSYSICMLKVIGMPLITNVREVLICFLVYFSDKLLVYSLWEMCSKCWYASKYISLKSCWHTRY